MALVSAACKKLAIYTQSTDLRSYNTVTIEDSLETLNCECIYYSNNESPAKQPLADLSVETYHFQ